jgi:hypothetical protein
MSPTATLIVFMLALVIDWMSVGPNSIRDRIAFFLAVAAVREGFNDSPLDAYTVGLLGDTIARLLDSTGGARIAGANINFTVGAAIGVLWIYTLGCVLPVKASKKWGRFATLSFPQSPLHRLNIQMWIIAFALGMMADLPQGAIGMMTGLSVEVVTTVVGPLPAFLFGAA